MSKLNQAAVSKGTVLFVAASVVLVLVIVVLGILPAKARKADADLEAIRLQARIEEQKILLPIYATLAKKLAEKTELEIVIQEVERRVGPLYIGDAPQVLTTMAGSAGLSDPYFVPVPESVTQNSSRLLVDGGFKGEHPRFRQFLMDLFAWHSFDHLELLEVKSIPQGTEYKVRVWVSLG